MSALGSSVLNKSSKKFAPKKAPSRRPAPEPSQPEIEPGVPVAGSETSEQITRHELRGPSPTRTEDANVASTLHGPPADIGSKRRKVSPTRPTPHLQEEQSHPRRSHHAEHPPVSHDQSEERYRQEAGPSTKRRSSASKKRQRQRVEEEANDIVEQAIAHTVKLAQRKKGRRSAHRDATPEDGESRTITTSEVTMTELCKDQGIGKRSSRQRDLKIKDQEAYVQKQQRALQGLVGQENVPVSNAAPESVAAPAISVPRTVIVNGQIQIDEDSLRIDRHAVADEERQARQDFLAPIEEDDLSRTVTSASFMRREKGGKWSAEQDELFYQGLNMFGTDFEMISRMIVGKTRRAIKLKFCREERLHHSKIKAALLEQQCPVVLEEYERMTGTEYKPPEELEELLLQDRKELEDEQAAEKEAIEEAQREREAQAAAETAAAARDRSTKPDVRTEDAGPVKKIRGRGPRQKREVGLGGA